MHSAEIVTSSDLTLPHPRFHCRAFALKPCAELDSRAIHPALGIGIGKLLSDLETGDTVRKLPRSGQDRFARMAGSGRRRSRP